MLPIEHQIKTVLKNNYGYHERYFIHEILYCIYFYLRNYRIFVRLDECVLHTQTTTPTLFTFHSVLILIQISNYFVLQVYLLDVKILNLVCRKKKHVTKIYNYIYFMKFNCQDILVSNTNFSVCTLNIDFTSYRT